MKITPGQFSTGTDSQFSTGANRQGEIMLRNIFITFLISVVLSGCVSLDQIRADNSAAQIIADNSAAQIIADPSLAQIRADNSQKLIGLSLGMSKQDVLSVMGTKTIRSSDERYVISNPYRNEMYRFNGHVFELLFYFTDIKKSDGAITDDELTPLIVIDGKLDGWGWEYWNGIVKKYEIRVR